jgi:hypothetical protein
MTEQLKHNLHLLSKVTQYLNHFRSGRLDQSMFFLLVVVVAVNTSIAVVAFIAFAFSARFP